MALEILTVQAGFVFSATQCGSIRPGLGTVFSPQELSQTNTYKRGDSGALSLNGLLCVKMFTEPGGTDSADISSTGSILDPTRVEIMRLETLKEFAIVLLPVNPDDSSDGPDSVDLTLSASIAAALGLPAAAVTKTLKVGESMYFGNPQGNTLAADGKITVVNNDTMNYSTVLVYAAGFKVGTP